MLTVFGRGRAWDEWDVRGAEPQPVRERTFQQRFVQTLSFSALFFAGLALSAGAGNGVRGLIQSDTDSAAVGATGASGASGATGATGATGAAGAVLEPQQRTAVLQARPVATPARPTASAPVGRVAVLSSRPTHVTALSSARPLAEQKRTAIAKTHTARPARTPRKRPHAPKHSGTAAAAPKAPPLDPEVHTFPSATVWLNRAAPDPTPPAARLQLAFARQLVADSRAAHVDWALVLATLRAQGHNGRSPAGKVALHSLAFRLSGLGARGNAWAAALAYSSDTTLADRVVALRHYYRAVGLASLVHGLLSQKKDLQDRVLHDSRLHIYSGGRHDVATGHVDVRILATMLYLAETYHEVTVSCLISGHRLYARPGVVSAHIYGRAVDVAALNNISIAGHQQAGGITEQAVRSVLMLPGGMLPAQVISLLGLGGPSFPLANHWDHIHIGY
jgi:hypothetical protein